HALPPRQAHELLQDVAANHLAADPVQFVLTYRDAPRLHHVGAAAPLVVQGMKSQADTKADRYALNSHGANPPFSTVSIASGVPPASTSALLRSHIARTSSRCTSNRKAVRISRKRRPVHSPTMGSQPPTGDQVLYHEASPAIMALVINRSISRKNLS